MAKKTTLNEVGEMLAHVVEHMATKDDVAALRKELKGDIAGLRTELKGDIAEVRKEMATKVDIAGSWMSSPTSSGV